jgi:hypothetical protein
MAAKKPNVGPEGFIAEGRTQLEALVSPTRQEIVDTVQALGPCSIAAVADAMGRPADALYYHFRRLVRAGLLLEAGTRKAARREETFYDVAGRPVALQAGGEMASSEAVVRATTAMLRLSERTFVEAVKRGRLTSAGGQHDALTAWGGRTTGWLTDADVDEVNRLLQEITALFGRRRRAEEGRLHAVTFLLCPITPVERPSTRQKSGGPAGSPNHDSE